MSYLRNSLLILSISFCCIACGGSPSSGDGGNEEPPPEPSTEDTTPPSSPGGLGGNSGNEIVELNWEANSEDDLEGYNLYRSEESFSDVSGMDPLNGSLLSGTDYSDEDVQNGTTYYYRLTAVDENDNESNNSPEIEVTPFSNPPDRPKN